MFFFSKMFFVFFNLRVGGYPRFKFGWPAPAPLKIISIRTRTRDLKISNSSTRTRPAAGQTGRGPRIMIKISSYWILFNKVSKISLIGGTFDARANGFWACRKSGQSCPPGVRVCFSPLIPSFFYICMYLYYIYKSICRNNNFTDRKHYKYSWHVKYEYVILFYLTTTLKIALSIIHYSLVIVKHPYSN